MATPGIGNKPFFPLDESSLQKLEVKANKDKFKRIEKLLTYLSSEYSHLFLQKNRNLGPKIIKIIDIGIRKNKLDGESVKKAVKAMMASEAMKMEDLPKDLKVRVADGNDSKIVYLNRSLVMSFLPKFLKEENEDGICISKNVFEILHFLLCQEGIPDSQDLIPTLYDTVQFLLYYEGTDLLPRVIEKLNTYASTIQTEKDFDAFFIFLGSCRLDAHTDQELRKNAIMALLNAFKINFEYDFNSTYFRGRQQHMEFPGISEKCKTWLMKYINGFIVHGTDLEKSSFTLSFLLDKKVRLMIQVIEFKGIAAIIDFLKSSNELINLKETFPNLHSIKSDIPFDNIFSSNLHKKIEGVTLHISVDSKKTNQFELKADEEAVFLNILARDDIVLHFSNADITFKLEKEVSQQDRETLLCAPGFKKYNATWKSGSVLVINKTS